MTPQGNAKYSAVLMFGGPGSGKGTQGVVLGQFPNLVHLAMGDIFRALDRSSAIGKEFLSYSTRGALAPDELTIRVFRTHLENMEASGKLDASFHTLLLDGIPRTPVQVVLLTDVIEVKKIVHLVMDDREALAARLLGRAKKSGRSDDTDRAVVENRIDVYERETCPVLRAYPDSLIARIQGNQPPLAVLRDIADSLVCVISPRL